MYIPDGRCATLNDMRKKDVIPQPCNTSEVRIVDLSREGLPFLPVFAHTHYTRPGEIVDRHRHAGFIEVMFCRRGDHTTCDCEGEDVDFRPGDVFVAQPEKHHFLKTCPRGLETYWFWIKLAASSKQFPHLSAHESRELLRRLRRLPVCFVGGDRIRQSLRTVWDACDRPTTDRLRALPLRLAVYDLLLALTEAAANPRPSDATASLDTLLKEMREHPERPYPINELSRRLGVNAVYLNRLFTRATGLPPHAYLASLRVKAAKELLTNSTSSIATIARKLGYSSPQHFATQFRQETGLSPRAWRQQRQDDGTQ